tara:strand:+ start:10173 stop:10688 length:516 start_codon:yes stop_codon:yes gene_type:complete
MKKPKIIVIGGATATSKSTFSFELMKKHKIVHKLGSGFIREMAKNFYKKKKFPTLYNHSYQGIYDKPFQNLYEQSKPLKKMIHLAIKRANREGTSIIIEGVNLIPGLTEFKEVSKKYMMVIKNEKKHLNRILKNKTHLNRKVSNTDFKKIRKIQEILILRATKYNWNIIEV